jgi:crotonobetainyl-CoA:carnitine CoA-transferase CaiB-like acyl-CoA transferase
MKSLDRLRVVEIAEGVAGPACGLMLADLGATVIKVEPPHGDRSREWGPPMIGDTAAVFCHLNGGKHSVVADLTRDDDCARIDRLIDDADAVVVHQDPVDRAECRLDWDAIRMRRPELVLVEIDDIGFEGSLAGAPGSELTVQALSGLTRYVGTPGGEPARVGFEIAGMAAGQHAFHGLVSALIERHHSGTGQRVRVCTLASLLSMKAILFNAQDAPERWDGFHLNNPYWPYDYGWVTADGQVTFDFRPPQRAEWVKFCEAVGLGDLPNHPDYQKDWRSSIYIGDRRHTLGKVYEPVFAKMTCQEASDLINGLGGISVKFQDFAEVLAHPQSEYLQPLVATQEADGREHRQVGVPFKLQDPAPPRIRARAPRLGEHTAQWLGEGR